MRKTGVIIFFVLLTLFYSLFVFNIYANNSARVTFVDIGQGDSQLVTSIGGRNVLIDSGNDDASTTRPASIISYLRSHNISNIDVATFSHYHSDHMGGLQYVLSEYNVQLLILPFPTTEEEIQKRDELLKEVPTSTRVIYTKFGDNFSIGDIVFKTVYNDLKGSDNNSKSVVLEANIYDKRFLFTGDISSKNEEQLISVYNQDVDVVKVAHHGSKYSSSDLFYNTLKPEFAVIGVGAGNMYGHPTSDAMLRIEKSGAKIYRTDRDGNVSFIVNKEGMKIKNDN